MTHARSLLGAALFAASVTVVPSAQAQCLPLMCNFTESGKKGPYLKTDVKPAELAKLDAAIQQGQVDGALSAAGSINRGEFYGAGLKMPQTEAALMAIVGKLGAQWPHRQPAKISIRMVAKKQFAPQAHPDGVIIVPLGMLSRSQNDDQVGWLMGHEFSHLALGHFAREAKMRKVKRATSSVVAMLQGGVSMSQSRYSFTGGQLQVQNRETEEGRKLSDRIYFRSRDLSDILALANQFFSRSQEDQADVLGMDLARLAGFRTDGAGEALDEISRTEDSSANLFKSITDEMTLYSKNYLATSLTTSEDMNAMGQSGKNFLATFFDNLKQVALNKAFEYYSQSHRPTDKRRKGLGKYELNAYPDAAAQMESKAWLGGVQATREYQQAALTLEAVTSAEDLAKEGKFTEAVTAIKPAFLTDYANSPFVANAAANIFWSAGNKAEADRQFSIAARLPGNGAGPRGAAAKKGKKGKAAPTKATDLVYSNDQYFEQNIPGFHRHIELLIEMKSYPKALSVIDVASGRFGDDYAFLPAKTRIYIAQRNAEGLVATLTKCASSQDETLRRQCIDATMPVDKNQQVMIFSPVDQAKIDREREKLASAAESKNFWDQIAASLKASEE